MTTGNNRACPRLRRGRASHASHRAPLRVSRPSGAIPHASAPDVPALRAALAKAATRPYRRSEPARGCGRTFGAAIAAPGAFYGLVGVTGLSTGRTCGKPAGPSLARGRFSIGAANGGGPVGKPSSRNRRT